MTLTLHLPPDLEQRLVQEAKRQGLSADEYTQRILEQSLPPNNRQKELTALLQQWIDRGDAAEQQETGEYLIQALDEDRLSARKLFPADQKGKTW